MVRDHDGVVTGSDKLLRCWVMMTICSAISLGSIVATNESKYWDSVDKLLISVGAIVMSIGAVCSCLLMSKAKETMYQFPASSLCLILWAVGLGFLFYRSSSWWNLNIYYFSWGALISAVLLFTGYVKDYFDVDNGGRKAHRGYRFTAWSVLCASSVIVMSTLAYIYHGYCDSTYYYNYKATSFCKRSALGVGLGASSTVVALAMLAFLGFKKNILIVEGVLSGLVCVAYAVGVGYITGPLGLTSDYEIGNLYYSIWIAFLDSVLLLLDCISEFTSKHIDQQEENGKEETNVPEGPKIENA